MVSKASEDFPDPESPVKTTSRSLGISRWTSFRLCSRAPRTTMRSATGGRLPGGCDGPFLAQLGEQAHHLVQLVAQGGGLLEAQLLRRRQHLALQARGVLVEHGGVRGAALCPGGLLGASAPPASPALPARVAKPPEDVLHR